MLNRKALILASSAFVALGLLSGCELEDETTCQSDADCTVDGETCQNISTETNEGTCQPVTAPTCGGDVQCSGGFACDATAGTCAATCDATAGCVEGFTCDTTTSTCAADVVTYPYIALISSTTDGDDLNDTNNPGPDIDAIQITHGGANIFATGIEASNQGAGGNSAGENSNRSVNAVLNANDQMPNTQGSDCGDLLEDPNALYWSMGDNTGFVVVSFGSNNVESGDTVTVWEVDNNWCDDISVERNDSYIFSAGTNNVVTSSIATANDISGAEWLSFGTSNAFGGVTEAVFQAP